MELQASESVSIESSTGLREQRRTACFIYTTLRATPSVNHDCRAQAVGSGAEVGGEQVAMERTVPITRRVT